MYIFGKNYLALTSRVSIGVGNVLKIAHNSRFYHYRCSTSSWPLWSGLALWPRFSLWAWDKLDAVDLALQVSDLRLQIFYGTP